MIRLLRAHTACFAVACLLAGSTASGGEIEWRSSVRGAWKEAIREKRPLLLFCTMDGCGYCRQMERKTWSDVAVADRVSRGFVPVILDRDADPSLAERLGISAFPTTLVIMPDARVAETLEGYRSPGEVRRILDRVSNRPSGE